MSHSQFHSTKLFILRHAWLNLWDKHMTTGRINQVTLVKKKNRNKKMTDRSRALSKKYSILFFFVTRTTTKNCRPGSGSVIRYDSVYSKEMFSLLQHMFVTIIRSQLDKKSPSLSVICHEHPIAKSLVFFPGIEHWRNQISQSQLLGGSSIQVDHVKKRLLTQRLLPIVLYERYS